MKNYLMILAAAVVCFAGCTKGGDDSDPNTLVYGGVTYKTITLDNGQTWMAEPLRYIPEGKTVSDDPTDADADIFYPYEIRDIKRDTTYKTDKVTINTVSVSGTAVAMKDEASIKKKGYLYTLEAALGQEITDDLFTVEKMEGLQGICPDGWYIPTRTDYQMLIGTAPKALGETAAPTTIEDALFYDKDYKGGKVSSFNDAGWNFVLSGSASVASGKRTYNNKAMSEMTSTKKEWYGSPNMTYIITSTPFSKSATMTMYVGVMTTFTYQSYVNGVLGIGANTSPEGKVTMAGCNALTGAQLRCIKKAE